MTPRVVLKVFEPRLDTHRDRHGRKSRFVLLSKSPGPEMVKPLGSRLDATTSGMLIVLRNALRHAEILCCGHAPFPLRRTMRQNDLVIDHFVLWVLVAILWLTLHIVWQPNRPYYGDNSLPYYGLHCTYYG